jgi:hypothetical protein
MRHKLTISLPSKPPKSPPPAIHSECFPKKSTTTDPRSVILAARCGWLTTEAGQAGRNHGVRSSLAYGRGTIERALTTAEIALFTVAPPPTPTEEVVCDVRFVAADDASFSPHRGQGRAGPP